MLPDPVYLWQEEKIPLYDPAKGAFRPHMYLYPLEGQKSAPAVLVIPGGAYAGVCMEDEGHKLARFLNRHGYAAAVLNYRVAPYAYPAMLLDAQRAMRTLRRRADEWGIDPGHIGVMGFSAGGHLAMMTALLFDEPFAACDETDLVSARPDMAALCYAVASLDPAITHAGTRQNLIGSGGDPALGDRLTGECLARPDAPPFFLWHTAADDAVNVNCSLRMASALAAAGVPAETHIFPYGPHGLDLAENEALANSWGDLYIRWLDFYCKRQQTAE